MNKRQKKKIGSRYHLLRNAKRHAQKRKGEKCVAYTIVDMGVNDRERFWDGGFEVVYSYATHWFVKVVHRKNCYFGKEHAPYQTLIYPCTSRGTSDHGPLQILFHSRNKPEEMLPFFQKLVDDMKSDQYWEADE